MYGKGFDPPSWMDSPDSIEALAARYRSRVPELLDQHEGALVMGSYEGAEITCVEDRATGQVFYCPLKDHAPGDIIAMDWRCPHGGDVHRFPMRLQIVREARMQEVISMTEKSAYNMRCQLATRTWYEVQVD